MRWKEQNSKGQDVPEMDGKEYKSFVFISFFDSELEYLKESICDDRKKMIDKFDWKFNQIISRMHHLYEDIINVMPTKRLLQFQKEMPLLQHEVKYKPIGAPPDGMIICNRSDVNVILEEAMKDHCQQCMCWMDPNVAEKCRLRKAAMKFAFPGDLDGNSSCPYYECAIGDEVI